MRKKVDHKRHVHRLRHHRNALYGIVFVLLSFQIVTFVSISSQIAGISAQQGVMESDIERYVKDLEGEIGSVRQENQFGINAITGRIVAERQDIQSEINVLKAAQEDFSGVIEEGISGVASIVTDRSAGSGFITTADGYVVTNFHVIQGSEFVQVNTFDGATHDARVIGFDALTDIALLKIEGVFDPLAFAEKERVQIGEKVIAIGNPLGLSFTVTEGIISAVDRTGPNGLAAYIQTDVTLNPGNSGGPLINKEGDVVGINNFKIGGAESLGFALDTEVVQQQIEAILLRTQQQDVEA